MGSFIVYTAFVSWGVGILFLAFSNATFIISKIGYERSGWRKYRMGYTIKEITEVINMIEDSNIKSRLTRKIVFRKIGWTLLALTPVLYILGFTIF